MGMERKKFPFRWGALARTTAARFRHEEGWLEPVVRGAVRTLQGLAVTAGWRLDNWLYPSWREATFDGPIFIIGHWRSGTTFVHRALVDDTLEAGVAMNFAETHAPPISLRRMVAAIGQLPPFSSDDFRDKLRRIDDERFEEVDGLHRTRLREIAEDSHLLKTMFASIMWMEGGPWTFEAPEFREVLRPETRSIEEQRRTLRAYRDVLRKNAWLADAETPVVVGKNPELSKRLPLVREVFPEAKFVYLPRNPLETIPSLLELIERIWEFTSNTHEMSSEHGTLLEPSHARHKFEDCITLHRRLDRDLEAVDEADKFVVPFEEFVADPADQIEAMVEQFGFGEVDSAARERIAARSERVQDESRSDRATPDDYGLDVEEIVKPLADYFDRWGFDREL
ncbi:MAG: sulfotransferase [Bradymonadaceae bacterium]